MKNDFRFRNSIKKSKQMCANKNKPVWHNIPEGEMVSDFSGQSWRPIVQLPDEINLLTKDSKYGP